MKPIHLEKGHHVNLSQHEVLALKVAHKIQHKAPVLISRLILYTACSDCRPILRIAHLDEGLHGIEGSGDIGRLHADALGIDRERICSGRLSLEFLRTDMETDQGFPGRTVHLDQGKLAFLKIFSEHLNVSVGGESAFYGIGSAIRQIKPALRLRIGNNFRDNAIRGSGIVGRVRHDSRICRKKGKQKKGFDHKL